MKLNKNTYHKIITLIFVLLLIIPNAVMLFGLENSQTLQPKKYKAFPKLSIKQPYQFLKNVKGFFNENYGLKTTFNTVYFKFKQCLGDENPIPMELVKGKEDWYFLGNRYNNTLNDCFGNDSFLTEELQLIKNNIQSYNNYFKAKGILFYVIIPPDKSNIYKEFLPYQLQQSKTKLEVLKTYLKQELDIDIIDFSEVLKEKKKHKQVYYKTDSHWNNYGAFYAYQDVLQSVNTKLHVDILQETDFNYTKKTFTKFDLTRMLNKKVKENYIEFNLKQSTKVIKTTLSKAKYLQYKNPSKKYNVLMYRDSFANALIPFFNETFAESTYIQKKQITKKDIELLNPDIVILEIVERNLNHLLNQKPLD